jgi:hypothetical protein
MMCSRRCCACHGLGMFPDNVLSTVPRIGQLIEPKDEPFDPRISRHRGGVAIGDSSKGLNFQTWTLQIDNDDLKLSTSFSPPTVVLTVPGVSECGLAFDQNMRIAIAYQLAESSNLYYYDSILGAYTTLTIPDGRFARAITDDVRDVSNVTNANDVLFFYVLNDVLCMRVQRERFLIEHSLRNVQNYKLEHVGMTNRLRVQMEFVYDDPYLKA